MLTVAVVTLPFSLEGKRRMSQALDGLTQLRDSVDSVIAIPNDRLLNSVARNTPVAEAFRVADDVLRQAVQGISDIITVPGQINLDFADVRAVMRGMGQAVMGTGVGQGENRAVEAAQRAISNPLLEDSSIEGAKGVIVNITGGSDLSLSEAAEATALITKVADPDANVIYGIVTDESMGNAVKVTVIATGFNRAGRKAVSTPIDLANYMAAPSAATLPAAAAAGGAGEGLLPQDAEPQGRRRGRLRASTSTCRPSCAARAATAGATSVAAFKRDAPLRRLRPRVPSDRRLAGHRLRDRDARAAPLLVRRVDGRLRPRQRGRRAADRRAQGREPAGGREAAGDRAEARRPEGQEGQEDPGSLTAV